MDTDTAYKHKIGLRLANILITAFENGRVQKADMSYLATYISGALERAQDSSEVFNFVVKLAHEWPVFSELINEPTGQTDIK